MGMQFAAGLSLVGGPALVRFTQSLAVPGEGQLAIAQGTDPIGGTRLQEIVRLGWRDEGEADC